MTTFNAQVAASADDARYSAAAGTVYTDTSVLLTSSAHWGGVRFTNVTVPQGTTITSATLQLYLLRNDIYMDIYGDDTDNADDFATTAIDVRTRTTAADTVDNAAPGTGAFFDCDCTTAVQEIINRPGFSSGNAIALLIDELDSLRDMEFSAYDGSTANAPKLVIEYTAATSGDVLNRGLSNIADGVIASGGGGHSGLHPISEGFIS